MPNVSNERLTPEHVERLAPEHVERLRDGRQVRQPPQWTTSHFPETLNQECVSDEPRLWC